jgi:hypothetical protein
MAAAPPAAAAQEIIQVQRACQVLQRNTLGIRHHRSGKGTEGADERESSGAASGADKITDRRTKGWGTMCPQQACEGKQLDEFAVLAADSSCILSP